MKYQAIFSDIDGTLIKSDHRLSERTRAAIARITARGIPFILISARPPLAITPFVDAIGGKQPLAAFNGALILDHEHNPLYSATLDNRDLHQLETRLENTPAIHPNYYRNLDWLSPDPDNPWTQQESNITGLRADAKPAHLENIHKILVMGEAADILTLEQQLKPQYPHLHIQRSKTTYLEIAPKTAGKAHALTFLAAHLGIPTDATAAFGDNYNDLDMLLAAGTGIAMANAPDDIKAQADTVAPSNDEDGVAHILEQWLAENTMTNKAD